MTTTHQTHKRRDHGVLIRHELYMQQNIFIVEIFHNKAHCSVCASTFCKHAKLAMQIEEQFLESKKDPNISSCLFCGRLAKKFCGVAICSTCSN